MRKSSNAEQAGAVHMPPGLMPRCIVFQTAELTFSPLALIANCVTLAGIDWPCCTRGLTMVQVSLIGSKAWSSFPITLFSSYDRMSSGACACTKRHRYCLQYCTKQGRYC
jgi:hypothetical protein